LTPSDSALLPVLQWTCLICFVYLLGANSLYLTMLLVGTVENALRRRESRAEDFETLSLSRFTIPVSVLAPAYNEEPIVSACVRSLLDLDYPQLEVIVVNDGSTDGTLEVLKREFDLYPLQIFYRRIVPTREVRAVYRSARDGRLLVVDKVNGGKADALNCGVNLARYRYVCCVDSDSIYTRGALLKGMRLAVKDPARVIGMTSHITVSEQPETAYEADSGRIRLSPRPLFNFQHLDYLRSFLASRLAWSRFRFMLSTTGVFSIWRRDVVEELGGFSTRFTCEDIELTFRAHHRFLRARRPYAILSLPDNVAFTEGPDRLSSLIAQRARWQRVIDETVWHYRSMIFNPRYGAVGLVGLPYYLFYEVLAPVFEFLALASLVLAWWLGALDWKLFLLYLGTISFLNGVLTNGALLLQEQGSQSYSFSHLCGLMILGATEFIAYRPVLFYARLKGTWGFLKRDKRWHKFERNHRHGKLLPAAGESP